MPGWSTTRAARSTTPGRRFASSSAFGTADKLEQSPGVAWGVGFVLVPEIGEDVHAFQEQRLYAGRFGCELLIAVGRVAKTEVAKVGAAGLGVDPRDALVVERLLDLRVEPRF